MFLSSSVKVFKIPSSQSKSNMVLKYDYFCRMPDVANHVHVSASVFLQTAANSFFFSPHDVVISNDVEVKVKEYE